VRVILQRGELHTVCEEARCPNLGDVFPRGRRRFSSWAGFVPGIVAFARGTGDTFFSDKENQRKWLKR